MKSLKTNLDPRLTRTRPAPAQVASPKGRLVAPRATDTFVPTTRFERPHDLFRDDATIIKPAQNSPLLEALNLRRCCAVTEKSVAQPSELRSGGLRFTDDMLKSLATCSRIEVLDVIRVMNIAPNGTRELLPTGRALSRSLWAEVAGEAHDD